MTDDPLSGLETREQALSNVRDALAAVNHVPAAALDTEKHATVSEIADNLQALESALQNEVEQQREDANR